MEEPVPNAKVLFRVIGENEGAETETLWAYGIGGDEFKLANSPFYAYSVSWEDVVLAPYNPEEGFHTFQHVVSKSGNRTIRILFDLPVEAGNSPDRVLQQLTALGCSYEGAHSKLISLNVPAEVDLGGIRDFLVNGNFNWEHADPTYNELYPSET